MSRALRLALCQYAVTAPAEWAAFAAKIDGLAADAVRGGAELLVLPEYAPLDAAAAHGAAGDVTRELAAVCDAAPRARALFAEIAGRHGIFLLPGSMPHRAGGTLRNRATLYAPDGTAVWQDKGRMTQFEAAPAWGAEPGAPHAVFDLPWGRTGIAICYDIEFPGFVRAQVEAGAWLILAPSCTDSLHGFNRVRLSARARALENQCYVAICPTVGEAPLACLDENHGYAAVFGPVDRGFPADGVLARGALDMPQLVFADLDPARLETVRRTGAVRNHADWPPTVPPCATRQFEILEDTP